MHCIKQKRTQSNCSISSPGVRYPWFKKHLWERTSQQFLWDNINSINYILHIHHSNHQYFLSSSSGTKHKPLEATVAVFNPYSRNYCRVLFLCASNILPRLADSFHFYAPAAFGHIKSYMTQKEYLLTHELKTKQKAQRGWVHFKHYLLLLGASITKGFLKYHSSLLWELLYFLLKKYNSL